MLMKLVWGVFKPIVSGILSRLPDAPDPVSVVMPWPNWLPFVPFGVVLATTLIVATSALGLRFIRWVYGLIPFVQ